jgi:phage tail sheath protein FI
VFKAPAGLQARLAGVVSVPVLTNADLDSLNSSAAPVNAIKFVSGSGIVVMGSKTLKPGYVDKYVPVRRTLIYLRKALTDLTEFAIFEPNDPALWRRIDSTVSSFLTQFWAQGGLAGTTPASAFFVKVDTTNNPQASIDNGQVNIEVGVALQRPAEFVIIKIGQFDGGTTVTVA